MNFENSSFVTSCFDKSQFTAQRRPEVVFVGRSNVGKSSMINALLSKKSLARVGSTPGKTICVNLYNVDEKIYFTDLPGYGYAKRSKEQRVGWGGLIGDYLEAGRDIRLIVFLVDSRHDPSEDDMLMYRYLMQKQMLFCIAATKADKLNKTESAERQKAFSDIFGVEALLFSAQNKSGVDRLRAIIEDVCSGNEEII